MMIDPRQSTLLADSIESSISAVVTPPPILYHLQ